ncbi:hypothetical protein [Brevibacillus laterosporus]|uniref:hypothetical protein n=1 Tax=Brevibacillus laterosporus TaxID=1465 RepID=UPI003D241212
MAACVPFAGWAATGTKFVKKGMNAFETGQKIVKAADKVIDTTKTAMNAIGAVVGKVYTSARNVIHAENPEWYPNPDESAIVKGNELKKARKEYDTLVKDGTLEKGHHVQGLGMGGENVKSNIKFTGESTISNKNLEGLDLDFYHEMGYGKKNAKMLKMIHETENGIIVFGNNPKHKEVTNFQNKVFKWQRGKRLR